MARVYLSTVENVCMDQLLVKLSQIRPKIEYCYHNWIGAARAPHCLVSTEYSEELSPLDALVFIPANLE